MRKTVSTSSERMWILVEMFSVTAENPISYWTSSHPTSLQLNAKNLSHHSYWTRAKIHVQVFPLPTVQFNKTVLWKVTRKVFSQYILINIFGVDIPEGILWNFCQYNVKFNIFSVSSENLRFFFSITFDYCHEHFFLDESEKKNKNKFDFGLKKKGKNQRTFLRCEKRRRRLKTFFSPRSSIWVAKIQEKRENLLSVSQWIKIIYVISQGKSEECREWWKRWNEIKECEEEYWMKKKRITLVNSEKYHQEQ